MLAPFHGQPMAPYARVTGSQVGIVNLMAGIAPEGLMCRRQPLTLKDRSLLRMTVQAFLVLRQQPSGPEIMAGRAGEVFHFDRQVFLLGMAVRTEGLIRSKLMQFDGMAGGTFKASLEPVQEVSPGLGNLGRFIISVQVAGEAYRAGNDDFIVRAAGHLSGTLHYGFNQHLVFFIYGGVMAGVALNTLVDAGFPGLVGVIHDVAGDAEFRVVFGVVVQMEGSEGNPTHEQSEQNA